MREPLGPGDFYSPDELDDGICGDCGYEDCTDDCLCDSCAPFGCFECNERIREDSPTLCAQITEDGDDLCDTCWKTYHNTNKKEA